MLKLLPVVIITKEQNISIFMCKVYERKASEPLELRINKFCSDNNLELKANSDIVRICKKFDFDVYKMPLNREKIDGIIWVDESNNIKRIGVNNALDMENSRFVIAHELAHYITQKENIGQDKVLFAMRDKIFHGEAKSQEENDMDYMAAAILVPKEEFLKDLNILKIDLSKIYDHKEGTVYDVVEEKDIKLLSRAYNVTDEVIVRRIAEVSYYNS